MLMSPKKTTKVEDEKDDKAIEAEELSAEQLADLTRRFLQGASTRS